MDDRTGQYFLHLFSKKQPDLNWENPDVRTAVYRMMNWWLEQGVAGFRMDVINLISKEPGLPDGPGFPQWANGPRIHEFLQEMNREVLHGKGLITVGEMLGCGVDDAKLYTDPNRNELNMVFTFEHMSLDCAPDATSKWDLAPLKLTDLKANLAKWQNGLAGVGWNSLYWNNHDQPRIVSRWGNDGEHRVASAKAFGTVLHLMSGTPYVYQGEEIGMTDAHFTELSQYRDLESLNWAAEVEGVRPLESVLRSLKVKGRDNARTPMQWDSSANGGFTSGTPWIEVNPNHTEINAAAAVADPNSVFHHYKKLIGLRHEHDVIVRGSFELLWPEHEQLFAYTRTYEGRVLTVVVNLSNESVSVPAPIEGDVLIGERASTLGPWQGFAALR
jgi:oligo-1,6-glucosidase